MMKTINNGHCERCDEIMIDIFLSFLVDEYSYRASFLIT